MYEPAGVRGGTSCSLHRRSYPGWSQHRETEAPAKVMLWRHFSWCRCLITQVLAVQSPALGAAPAIPMTGLFWRHRPVPHLFPCCSSDWTTVCCFATILHHHQRFCFNFFSFFYPTSPILHNPKTILHLQCPTRSAPTNPTQRLDPTLGQFQRGGSPPPLKV